MKIQLFLIMLKLLDLFLESLDARPTLADDDTGARGEDVDLRLVGGTLHLDMAHASVLQLLLDEAPQTDVLMQPLAVLLLLVPLAAPGTNDPKPEPKWMYFLAHAFPLVLVPEDDANVAGALIDPGSSAHGARAPALERRALIHRNLLDDEAVGLQGSL